MSVATEITRIQNAKAGLKTSIEAKGVTVASDALIDDYAGYVDNIPTGGGGTQDLVNLIERDITSLVIPNTVSAIGNYAFSSCNSLVSVTIPSSVTSIGYSSFSGCGSLTSVTITSSVTSIDYKGFNGCYSLTSVTCESTTPPTIDEYVFDNTNNCPIYVPSSSVSAYKAATNWSRYTSRIQAIPN